MAIGKEKTSNVDSAGASAGASSAATRRSMGGEPARSATPAPEKRHRHVEAARTERVFSGAPANATEWTCKRCEGATRISLTSPAADGVELQCWPIADLSVSTIRERWGAGQYEIGYLGHRGRRKVPLGRTKLKLRDAVVPAVTPAAVPSLPIGDPISGVVALMQVAQRQADTLVGQVRFDAERTVERERAFAQRELDRQQRLFEHIDKLRNEHQAAPAPPTKTDELIIALTRQLKKRDADHEPDTENDEPRSGGLQVLQALTTHVGPGLNNLLEVVAPSLKELLSAAAVRLLSPPAPVVRQAPVAPDPNPGRGRS